MARSRACLCSHLFIFFWRLRHRMSVKIHWKVSGVVFSTPGQILAATQMEFHHKSSMHAFVSMSAILYPSLVAPKDILLQGPTTTQIRLQFSQKLIPDTLIIISPFLAIPYTAMTGRVGGGGILSMYQRYYHVKG